MVLLAGIATPILIGSRLGFGRGLFELFDRISRRLGGSWLGWNRVWHLNWVILHFLFDVFTQLWSPGIYQPGLQNGKQGADHKYSPNPAEEDQAINRIITGLISIAAPICLRCSLGTPIMESHPWTM